MNVFHNEYFFDKSITNPRISFSVHELPPLDLNWAQKAGAHVVTRGERFLCLMTQHVGVCLDTDTFQENWRIARSSGQKICDITTSKGEPLWCDGDIVRIIDVKTGQLGMAKDVGGRPVKWAGRDNIFVRSGEGYTTLKLVNWKSGDVLWTYDMTDLRTAGARLDEEYCVLWGRESLAIVDACTGKEMHRRSFDEWLTTKLQFVLRDVPKHAQRSTKLSFGPRVDNIVLASGESGYVLALDIYSCEILWVYKLNGYAPMARLIIACDRLVVYHWGDIHVVDIKTGEFLSKSEGIRFGIVDSNAGHPVVLGDDLVVGKGELLFRWSIKEEGVTDQYRAPGKWFGPPATVFRDKIIWRVNEPLALAVWDIGSNG